MIGRADIEGSKSNVAMNAWLPQASYPCGRVSEQEAPLEALMDGSITLPPTCSARQGFSHGLSSQSGRTIS